MHLKASLELKLIRSVWISEVAEKEKSSFGRLPKHNAKQKRNTEENLKKLEEFSGIYCQKKSTTSTER